VIPYDLVILDLDGVVYLIDRPIPGAVDAVTTLHDDGTPIAYATNNASRSAPDVAALLIRIGLPARPDEIVTSAQAAATALAERHPPASPVLVIGADALRAEVRAVGLEPRDTADRRPAAVVQGYAPDVGWPQLAEACVAVRDGADWVVTNTDSTLPSERGPLPGNGALVAALRTALDRGPDLVVGKPEPGLFATAAKRAGAERPLVVGDRLDTDIEGAVRAGMDSLLVLTGITTAADLFAAPEHRRPTYVSTDLRGLFTVDPRDRLAPGGDRVERGGWAASREEGDRIVVRGAGTPLDAIQAVCAVAWSGAQPRAVVPDGPAARAALARLTAATAACAASTDRTGSP